MITVRDGEILGTLARKVRMITAVQAALAWWSGQTHDVENAMRRLRKLVEADWLAEFRVIARPLLRLVDPVIAWEPGRDEPSFRGAAWTLLSRWHKPASTVSIFVPCPRTLHYFDCPERPFIKSDCQVTHDLHVTQVYLVYRERWPDLADSWMGEDLIAPTRHHQVRPDALLMDSTGRPFRAVEFGGRYVASRLASFHQDCARRALPYEVW